MTTITKEAVLRAAEKSTPQDALKELFPEYFEEDTLAIKEGVFQSFRDDNLVEFCKKAFGDSDAIKIANSVERNNKARFRSLVVNEDYRVVVRPSTLYPDYTTIEIHKK